MTREVEPNILASTLAHAVNSERSALIPLLVKPNETFSRTEIRALIRDVQEPPNTVVYAQNDIPRTVENSLVPAGLLIMEGTDPWRVQRADNTQEQDAWLGFNLRFSSLIDPSLVELYSSSNDPAQRQGSVTRFAIFSALARLEPGETISLINLENKIQYGHILHPHLKALARIGLVEYSSQDAVKAGQRFRVLSAPSPEREYPGSSSEVPSKIHRGYYDGKPTLRRTIAEYINSNFGSDGSIFSVPVMLANLNIQRTRDRDIKISTILGNFVDEGKLERLYPTISSGEDITRICLDPEYETIVRQLVSAHDAIVEGDVDYIDKGIEHSRSITADKAKVTELLLKDKESSPHVIQRRTKVVIKALKEHGGSLTTKELADYLNSIPKMSHFTPDGLRKVYEKMKANGSIEDQPNWTLRSQTESTD